jgi:hypothetical protein
MALSGKLHLETGSQKFKMAAAKPAVSVSLLIYKIAEKFQRPPHILGVGELNDAIGKVLSRNRK